MTKNKYPHPKTGNLVSRQRLFQLRLEEQGKCIRCGTTEEVHSTQCVKCAKKQGVKETHEEKRRKIASIQWIKKNCEIKNDTGMSDALIWSIRERRKRTREAEIEDMILWMLYCASARGMTNYVRWFGGEYYDPIEFLIYRKRVIRVDDSRVEGIAVIPINEEGKEITWSELEFQ